MTSSRVPAIMLRLGASLLAVVIAAGAAFAAPSPAAAAAFEIQVPVLIYHHVTCDQPSNLPNTQIWICPARFEAQLKHLKDRGWRTITADQLADHVKNRTCPAPRTMVVTIDDSALFGYTQAAPILEKLGMRGTYFVVVGLAGQSNALSFNHMRQLVARGHAVGNHSMTHLDLVGRTQAQLDREVEQAQQKLAQELGYRPRTFAYPNGTHDANARQRAGQSGFELAFTADPTFTISSAKPLVAPRLFVSKRHDPATLAGKIEPYAQPCPTAGPATGAPRVSLPAGAQMGTSKVGIRVEWSEGAAAGATSFQLQQRRNGGSWATLSLPSARATAVNLLRAPGNTLEYRVRAAAGGSYGPWATSSPVRLTARQEGHSGLTLSGAWQRVSLSNAMGGALAYTSSSGAAASMSFTGSSIGWVAHRGPKRGVVDVYIDGVPAGTVDLYAASGSPRRLVFVRSWASSSSHTIELRPRGTARRPRADLDAFLILGP
ncbi:MAG TPA: polysaccharide deacetylase family protein [Candidatus Limnocylindrales bacterium]|nr:polysaccharide deacetylase family protein [Candidatus Limnocylindrales bacterium]